MEPEFEEKIVVAIDFGTTYSGFAYAQILEPDQIHVLTDWPLQKRAGGISYAKTLTSLYYKKEGSLINLKTWGWPALTEYTKDMVQSRAKNGGGLWFMHSLPVLDVETGEVVEERCFVRDIPSSVKRPRLDAQPGKFVTKFKLLLEKDKLYRDSVVEDLPQSVSLERAIVDYLTKMSELVMKVLRTNYGTGVSIANVQWCLTTPACWEDMTKKKMQIFAEMAGLVKGKFCSSQEASPYPVELVLEPEAASICCQNQIKAIGLKTGDKYMVVDIGGGTIDIVVHEIVADDGKVLQVKEAVMSRSIIGGGAFVDASFFSFVGTKIGCFTKFVKEDPDFALEVLNWWLTTKCSFDGTYDFYAKLRLPRELTLAWLKHLKLENQASSNYEQLELTCKDMKDIFEPEVDKTCSLISQSFVLADAAKAKIACMILVGGFAQNEYLTKHIKREFGAKLKNIIVPPNPGSAICRGAVVFGFNQVVGSRVSKKTYGIQTWRDFSQGDPSTNLIINDDGRKKCTNVFSVFVVKNDEIPVDKIITNVYCPSVHNQTVIAVDLYSCSSDIAPKYTTDPGCVNEQKFSLPIPEDLHLDKKRHIEVTMMFGRSTIEVSARKVNFGDPSVVKMYSVINDCIYLHRCNKGC